MARSIPAWAGETATLHHGYGYREVYPRVGGGNNRRSIMIILLGGLSPRGRGKPAPPFLRLGCHGSIPAWAGETRRRESWPRSRGVYPRVGGGNFSAAPLAVSTQGLSPRGRGKRPAAGPPQHHRRSIPAWAGETVQGKQVSIGLGVYPRVGGGNTGPSAFPAVGRGLSPRGRGKRARLQPYEVQRGSIPAWAGETLGSPAARPGLQVYPRVGGGNLTLRALVQIPHGLSPRGRGKHLFDIVLGL